MDNIHAIILTFNEERHISRCLDSILPWCSTVTVIDSGSTDGTVSIAEKYGATVETHPWTNYATQMNYGIALLANRGGWLLRIDADEVLDPASTTTLTTAISGIAAQTDGLLVQRRIHFMGRRIRHGSIEPSWQLRLWRNGRGRCEERWMDEHIKVLGLVEKSNLVVSDINLNSLSWWTEKHNCYASREAVDILNQHYKFFQIDEIGAFGASSQARTRRWLKHNLFLRAPAGTRAIAYFIYRYFIRLGFLDGKAGLYFHLLQGLWYRLLVDAKVDEIVNCARNQGISLVAAIRQCTGIDLTGTSGPTAASSPLIFTESRPL